MASKNPIDAVLAGGIPAFGTAGSDVTEQLSRLTQGLQQLQTVGQAQAESIKDNTRAVDQNSTSKADGSSVAGTVGKAVQGVFGSGLGLSPLISGLVSLFGGGGGASAPPALIRFALPPAIAVDAGVSESVPRAFGVDYAQGGQPRPVTAPAPQITVQVQAMDSRSFLDHSTDIAMAVRQAMLESSVLSDVIREA